MNATPFDSYIFDMDGTLWDAVDSYCDVWNEAIRRLGLSDTPQVVRPSLERLMGKSIDVIYDTLIGPEVDRSAFLDELQRLEDEMMPRLGGRLYPGVADTLAELHGRGARLFMVSNCGREGLPNFLSYTGLRPLFTDALSLGSTGLDKTQNMLDLVSRYGLRRPVYVGDTTGDRDYTHAAGIPFVWAAYGFGRDVDGADYTINSFPELTGVGAERVTSV